MVFEVDFLRLTVTVHFQKNDYFKNVNFVTCFFSQSISYNNIVLIKQIYFSSLFLKPRVHISDNIAGIVANLQYY